jgi:SpoVK/Ycf46/Vps4 family AAA+-type ATPase
MSAAVIANALKLPLFTVRLDAIISRYLGESSSKLRSVFTAIQQTRAVYLFDEFDSVGLERGSGQDV